MNLHFLLIDYKPRFWYMLLIYRLPPAFADIISDEFAFLVNRLSTSVLVYVVDLLVFLANADDISADLAFPAIRPSTSALVFLVDISAFLAIAVDISAELAFCVKRLLTSVFVQMFGVDI